MGSVLFACPSFRRRHSRPTVTVPSIWILIFRETHLSRALLFSYAFALVRLRSAGNWVMVLGPSALLFSAATDSRFRSISWRFVRRVTFNFSPFRFAARLGLAVREPPFVLRRVGSFLAHFHPSRFPCNCPWAHASDSRAVGFHQSRIVVLCGLCVLPLVLSPLLTSPPDAGGTRLN